MIHKTRTTVLAALALAALTGCGGATEAATSNVYEPLPPLSSATPTTAPRTQPTSRPAPESSPSPTAGSADETEPGPQGAAGAAGSPVGATTPGTGAEQVPASESFQPPRAVAAPVGGGAPARATERTSSTTTTVTTSTLAAGFRIVVVCEGRCVLEDLSAPALTGENGPISEDALQLALEDALRRGGGDRQVVTGELGDRLLADDWDLAGELLEGGDEKLTFSTARR